MFLSTRETRSATLSGNTTARVRPVSLADRASSIPFRSLAVVSPKSLIYTGVTRSERSWEGGGEAEFAAVHLQTVAAPPQPCIKVSHVSQAQLTSSQADVGGYW